MDEHDIEWRCGCGHTNPDHFERCDGCGEERYPDENEAERQGVAEEERRFTQHWSGHITSEDRDRDALRDAGRGHLA